MTILYNRKTDVQKILLFVCGALQMSRPQVPIHDRINVNCSFADFFEKGLSKISVQHCLKLRKASDKLSLFQFNVGVFNSLAAIAHIETERIATTAVPFQVDLLPRKKSDTMLYFYCGLHYTRCHTKDSLDRLILK